MSTLARYDTWIRSVIGPAAAGAQVFICGQPCAVSTTPTPQVQLYADNAGVTPIAQPLIADGFGHAFCYVASGTYTIVVVYGGSLVLSYVDQSITVGSGNSGNFVTGLPSITTAPAGDIITADGLGNVQDGGVQLSSLAPLISPKFKGSPWFDVTAYGATGNGSTDDTTAIQTAINAVPATGGTIFFPPTANSYAISSALVGVSNTNFVGVGVASKITYTQGTAANYPMLYLTGASHVVITGLNFTGSNAGGTIDYLWTNSEGTINGQEGVFLLGCADVEVYGNTFQNHAGAGILCARGTRERVHNNIANNATHYGIYFLSTDNGTPLDSEIYFNTCENNGIFGGTGFQGRGIVMTHAGSTIPYITALNPRIVGNICKNNSLWGIELYLGTIRAEVASNICANNGFGGIHLNNNAYIDCHDNEIHGNGLANVPNNAGGTLAGITGYGISLNGYYCSIHDNSIHDNNNGGGNLGQVYVSGEGNNTGTYGNSVIANHVRNNLAASGGYDILVSATANNTFAAVKQYYIVAAYSSTRAVLAVSAEVSVTPAATSVNLLTWQPVANATSYCVFRGTSSAGENQQYTTYAPAFLDENATALATATPPSSGTAINSVVLTNLTTPADTYATSVMSNDMTGSSTGTPLSMSSFNTLGFNNTFTTSNTVNINVANALIPAANGLAFGSASYAWSASLYDAAFSRSGGGTTTPDIFGDGSHTLVIGGKPDGSGNIAFGATTAVAIPGTLLDGASSAGTAGQVLTSTGSAIAWGSASTFATSNQGFFYACGIALASAFAYNGSYQAPITNTTANTVVVEQFSLQSSWKLSSVTYQLGTTSSAGSHFNFGIYNAAGSKLIDSGAFDGTSSAIQTLTFTPVTLPPGTYYFASSATDATMKGLMTQTSNIAALLAMLSTSAPYIATAANSTSSNVLPATLGTLTAITTASFWEGIPLCIWKV